MQKFIGVALLVSLLTVGAPFGAAAATLSVNNWQASGSQMWRITFPSSTGGLSTFTKTDTGASELYYPQSGTYAIVSYEEPLSPVHKVSVELGALQTMTPGTGSDSDWDYSRSQDLLHYGVFSTDGNSTLLNVDIKHAINSESEFFYGYGYSNSKYTMTQGYYSVMNGKDVNTSLPDLNSTYSLAYHGPHAGVAGSKQLAPKLALVGSLSYSPLTIVQGHGWWNLRSLDFQHLGTGQMLDGKIGLRYSVAGRRDNALTVGYRYQHYSLFTGTENTSDQITWSKAVKVQQGWYMGGDFSF